MTQDRQPFQLLYQQFSGPRGVVHIDVYKHPSISQKYVFWDNVEQVFPQAQCILQDNNVVSFLWDDQGLRYHPLRIAFHQGIVLGVMLNKASASSLRELRLRNLETVKIYTDTMPGIVAGSDFEYLTQPLDRQRDLLYLALLVFVYRESPMKNDYHDVVKILEEFRPGVEFRFIEQCTTDEAL